MSRAAIVALTCVCLGGCAAGPPRGPADADLACRSGAIIGGQPADAAGLAAIGALGGIDPEGRYRPFCTGTLISPTAVLTGKHCTRRANGASLLDDGPLFFALGPDADAPLALVGVRAIERADPAQGGVAQLGSDVAIADLVEPVGGVTPLPPSMDPLSHQMIGEPLIIYGFGSDVAGCPEAVPFRALRRSGSVTLRALRGNVFDAIYGGYDAFRAAASSDRLRSDAAIRYQTGYLLEGYEVWAGRDPGGAQACHGDSGGPVFRRRDGQLELVGVVSWSWQSSTELCDDGSVFAVFGPSTWSLLAGR